MYKKVIGVVLLVIVLLAGAAMLKVYRSYQDRVAERRAAMQQKAEEVSVTTIEGWTTKDVAAAIEKSGLASAAEFTKAAESFDFQSYTLIDKPAKTDLEGYLFPDTYRFAKDSSIETILDKMLNNFTNRLNSLGVNAPKNNFVIPGYEDLEITGGDNKPGLSLYDVIILASVIEKMETCLCKRSAVWWLEFFITG
jgi:cell division protein YceG involved in septum cleavage